MWQLCNHWIRRTRCIKAFAGKRCRSARHLRTWIPLASRGARPEHVQSRRRGASWEPVGGLLEASWELLWVSFGLFGGLSPLPPFHIPSPSSLPAPALIMGAAVTNFHLAGAAPHFAQGGKISLRSSRCVAFWGLLWGLLEASWGLLGGLLGASWGPLGASWWPLGASWGRLGPSWGAFAPFRPFGSRLGGLSRPPWGSLGVLLGRLRGLLDRLGGLFNRFAHSAGPSCRIVGL